MTSADSPFVALEALLSRLMLAGVICSASALLIGLVMFLGGAGHRATAMILAFGLVVLMATPVMRVAVSVVESLRTGDWFFVSTTIAVLVLLGLTLAHAVGYF
jgi:uncharacterized membrane protein